jgi:hypothetical protein
MQNVTVRLFNIFSGLIIQALLLVFLTGQIFGAEYFVNSNAPSGGNGSSWAQAWQSFSDFDINTEVDPNSIIYVAPGIYNTSQAGGNGETAVVNCTPSCRHSEKQLY